MFPAGGCQRSSGAGRLQKAGSAGPRGPANTLPPQGLLWQRGACTSSQVTHWYDTRPVGQVPPVPACGCQGGPGVHRVEAGRTREHRGKETRDQGHPEGALGASGCGAWRWGKSGRGRGGQRWGGRSAAGGRGFGCSVSGSCPEGAGAQVQRDRDDPTQFRRRGTGSRSPRRV